MAILKILTAPDTILQKASSPVDKVNDSIRQFMDDMLETMYEDNGVGLAANQVGVLSRVMVIDLQNDDDQSREKGFYPLFIVNPEILEISDEMIEADEGCMSLPGQRIPVSRPKYIKIKYLDYNNKNQELATDGWLARAIQHEMDHLDGKLAIDYLSNLKKNVALRKLVKLKKLSD
ncbi:MAG: peptide deformylase [Rickettsiaceae bacterium]|nr:peptide deformylase [Rickettsiaceae bacterium]MDP4832627.1 peptide deformylase [Rickettsiaceae bacterium]MDP5021249.1 peptide deformylase [Rickettsiaceae bacterium]MDP5083176.1 peptide deformylase [Rickettsiaceae bacterium]